MAVPEPPQSLIFDSAQFDDDDPVDMEMSQAHRSLMESLKGMSEIDIHTQLQDSASNSMQKHTEIINGLLYGILTINSSPSNNINNPGPPGQSTSATELFRQMNFVARDALAFAVRQTRYFCSLMHFYKIRPQVREQLLWLVGQLTEIKVHGVEQLYMALLRQIRGGDVSQPNVQHAEAMLRLLRAHIQPWLYSFPVLVAYSCFTYLRVMLDHGRLMALRQQEAMFCARLLRERFRDCSDVGRDLVRVLQDVARIKEIEEIWVDLLHCPEKLNPQLEGIHQLLATPSKEIYLASRLTFDMEHKLLHILKHINVGNHHRNLQWFIDRYLSTPESETLYSDLIRYICGVYHPTNAVLASSIVPRYVLIGGLIRIIRSNVVASNVKLALFYDWLFYDPVRDSIMNIEPAMLLMERSVERYPYITAILLEFLHFTVENYHPPLRDYIHKHVGMAAQAIVDKGVIRSFRLIYKASSLDDYPPVREYMLSMFPAQVGDMAENASGSSLGVTSTESVDDNHSTSRSIGESDSGGGVDEFESSPPHSGYMAQGIAGEDDDEESKAEGRKSRNHSRESSREPMQTDGVNQASEDDDVENGEEEVMESSAVDNSTQQQPRLQNPSVLSDWTFTDDISTTTGSGNDGDITSAASIPIPGASLWIFGSSLQEFKKAYEADSQASETANMFKRIWEVYGDVAGAGVEASDIADEIGQEICSFAQKAEVPESYVLPISEKQLQDEDAGTMEVLISCLWRVTQRDGKDGALRVAQVFMKSEATEDPSSRVLGMWYLLGLIRGVKRSALGVGISLEQSLQLYGSYLRASASQDQAAAMDEDGAEATEEPTHLVQEYLLRDLQLLQDRQLSVFDVVLPVVLQYLPELVPRTEAFLKLILVMATPAQIYRLSMGLFRRDFTLLSTLSPSQDFNSVTKEEEEDKKKTKNTRSTKKSGPQDKPEEIHYSPQFFENSWEPKVNSNMLQVLGQTLEWDTFEQLGVWQLIQSEIGGVPDAVATLLGASWVPDMSTQSTAEALSGVLNLVRTLSLSPPDVKLGRVVIRIASQTEVISNEMREFCEASVAQWARGYPDHLAAILLSLSNRTASPVQSSASGARADGDLEMEDVSSKSSANRGSTRNTRAKNGGAFAKTKLTPKQRKEQAIQLSAALSLLQSWWSMIGNSPISKQLFARIWSPQVKSEVQDALIESFGAGGKGSWPKEWWVEEEDESKSRRKPGRRDIKSDDEDEDKEEEKSEADDEDKNDDQSGDDDRRKKNDADQDDESDQEQSSDNEKKSKDRRRFGGAAGSAGSSRRNSPKVGSGAAFSNNNGTRKGSIAGSAVTGVLNSRSRGKNSPAPQAPKKAPAKKGGANRKRKVSEDDEDEEDEEEEEQDDEEEEEEEEAEEDEDEEDEDEEEEDEENEEDEEKDTKSKKAKAKKPVKKLTKVAASKTWASSRNKTKPTTRNGRRRQIKDEDEEEEDKAESDEEAKEDEDRDDDQEDGEGDQDNEDDEDEDDENDDKEELGNGKLPIYSQRRAAASANSKLMSKSSPTSSSSSASSSGAKSKAAAKRRGKRRIFSDDESDN